MPDGLRARCVGGPYAGQTFTISRRVLDLVHWSNWEYLSGPSRVGRRFPVNPRELPVAPLMWIINGADRHCYQLVQNEISGSVRGGWRLVYRDTF